MKALINVTIVACFFAGHLYSQVGIGTTTPDASSILDITATDKGVLLPSVSLGNVNDTTLDGTNAAETGLLIYNNNPLVAGGGGVGFYYFNSAFWQRLSTQNRDAENGLNLTGNAVRLGGSLLQNTTITNGAFDFDINLTNNGDFHIQDNGVNHFSVESTGTSFFGGNVFWRNNSTSGTLLAALIASGDDGQFRIYENGDISIDLDANGTSVFNEQGLDRDFRVESNSNPNALGVDAGRDIVTVGTPTVGLPNNGATINGVTVDYVASFYTPDLTNGTAIQLGSTEYIMDSGNLQMSVYGSWLPYYPMGTPAFTLGNAAQRWSSVWAINGTIQTSDTRLKKNIKSLDYGLTEILQINPITYQWKDGIDTSNKIGFSAEELLKIIPEVVVTHSYELDKEGGIAVKKENEHLGVYYSDLIPVLTKAIQEQQNLILKLEQRITTLENKN
ncbi:tail fiber domain-containing protein [Rasiella sp. SM2506]|uniref:tail fiber domain-containing protein n=1 Tax=Rasiella sp. SM2506 TaxID=3423914 RepID=UPI003D7969D9